jgi:hypothetical protein
VALFFGALCAVSCAAYVFSSEKFDLDLPVTTKEEEPEMVQHDKVARRMGA